MRCSFLLFVVFSAAAGKRLCLYDVPHSRQQRNALIQPTIEELLHELISSDSSHFRHAGSEELKDRTNWLIRIFEIGMAENKRTLLKKQEMLRFFRETAHVFSPRTDIVQFANDVVPQLETVAKKIREFGYEPLEVLRGSYKMAFTPDYLERMGKEEQLAMIKEEIKPAVLPPTVATTTTSTTTTTTTRPPPRRFFNMYGSSEGSNESDEDEERRKDDKKFKIEAGRIDEGPAAIIYTQAPSKAMIPSDPLCLNLERCNDQGECQKRIEGLYMTEEEICSCFEGFSGTTCSDRVFEEGPQHFLLSSSSRRSLAVFYFIQLGILFI